MNKECTCSIKWNIEKKAFTKTDKMENIMKKIYLLIIFCFQHDSGVLATENYSKYGLMPR